MSKESSLNVYFPETILLPPAKAGLDLHFEGDMNSPELQKVSSELINRLIKDILLANIGSKIIIPKNSRIISGLEELPSLFKNKVKGINDYTKPLSKQINAFIDMMCEEFDLDYNGYKFLFPYVDITMQKNNAPDHLNVVMEGVESFLSARYYRGTVDIDIPKFREGLKFMSKYSKKVSLQTMFETLDKILSCYDIRMIPTLDLQHNTTENITGVVKLFNESLYTNITNASLDLGFSQKATQSLIVIQDKVKELHDKHKWIRAGYVLTKSVCSIFLPPINTALNLVEKLSEIFFSKEDELFLPPVAPVNLIAKKSVVDWLEPHNAISGWEVVDWKQYSKWYEYEMQEIFGPPQPGDSC